VTALSLLCLTLSLYVVTAEPEMSPEDQKHYDETNAHFERVFQKSDSNGDGYIDLREFRAQHHTPNWDDEYAHKHIQKHMTRHDHDESGHITRDEWDKREREYIVNATKHHPTMDTDGDGKVSEREFSLANRRHFNRWADTNKDGFLSVAEYIAPLQKQLRAKSKKFDLLDKNGDGQLTEEELHPTHDKVHDDFIRLDDGHDGKLTRQDFDVPETWNGKRKIRSYFISYSLHKDKDEL